MDARNTILGAAITGILGVVLNNAFDEQTPACILAVTPKPLAGASCPDKAPVQIHDHREPGVIDGAGPAIGAANAIRQLMATSAQFPAAYYEESFVHPAHRNLMIITPVAGNPADQKELNSTKRSHRNGHITNRSRNYCRQRCPSKMAVSCLIGSGLRWQVLGLTFARDLSPTPNRARSTRWCSCALSENHWKPSYGYDDTSITPTRRYEAPRGSRRDGKG